MRKAVFAALLSGALLAVPLTGCGAAETPAARMAQISPGRMAPAQTAPPAPPQSEAACRAAGGRWAKGGMQGMMLCFTDLPDAGQACGRAGDCRGECLVVEGKGLCQRTTPMFGCYSFLDSDGKAVSVCRD